MAKTAKAAKVVIYRHTSNADWGHGVIVEETSSKVYVAFEDGKRRPFLNTPRYRELLVVTELEPEAAEQVLAKIAKGGTKRAPAAEKKSKSKKAAAPVEEVVEEVEHEEPEEDEGDEDESAAGDDD